MKCRYHPDREAAVKCNKMDAGYCRECLDRCEACTDPCGYCKFRNQCIIWELCKRSEKKKRLEKEARGQGSFAGPSNESPQSYGQERER